MSDRVDITPLRVGSPAASGVAELGQRLSPALRVLAGNDLSRFQLVREGSDPGRKVLARYAAVPSLADPRALLALDVTPAAWRAALAPHAAGAAGRKARFAARLLGVATHLGLGAAPFRDRVALVSRFNEDEAPLHAFLRDALGIADFHTNFRLAPGRPNSKPVVQIVSRDGKALAFAKFGWDSLTQTLIRTEAATLRALADTTRTGPIHVPKVLFADRWNDLEVLVVAPLADMGRAPWRSESEVTEAAIALAVLGETGRARLGDSAFWSGLSAAVDRLSPLLDPPTSAAVRAALDWLGREWGGTEVELGLSHGDWIPPNISIRRDGTFNVWDWERSEAGVPAGLDTLQFVLFDELRKSSPSPELVRRVERRGGQALADQGLEPDLARLLAALSLLRSILWYGEAIEAKRAGAEDSRFVQALEIILAKSRNALPRDHGPTVIDQRPSTFPSRSRRTNSFKMQVSSHEN